MEDFAAKARLLLEKSAEETDRDDKMCHILMAIAFALLAVHDKLEDIYLDIDGISDVYLTIKDIHKELSRLADYVR